MRNKKNISSFWTEFLDFRIEYSPVYCLTGSPHLSYAAAQNTVGSNFHCPYGPKAIGHFFLYL